MDTFAVSPLEKNAKPSRGALSSEQTKVDWFRRIKNQYSSHYICKIEGELRETQSLCAPLSPRLLSYFLDGNIFLACPLHFERNRNPLPLSAFLFRHTSREFHILVVEEDKERILKEKIKEMQQMCLRVGHNQLPLNIKIAR